MKLYFKFILVLMILGVASADAQINLRLPRVNTPKKEDVKTPETPANPVTGQTPAVTSARDGSNRQMVIDDGYTFFNAEPLQEHNAQLRRQVGIGWHLNSHLRMFGTVPNRSAFKVVVSKGGKDLAAVRCEGTTYRRAEDRAPQNLQTPGDDYMITGIRGCEDKTKAIKETGKLDVKVYFINGNTDEERLLRTYKIDVHEATRVRGLPANPVPDVSHYYIQRHAETAAAILFLRPVKGDNQFPPNYHLIAGENILNSEVDIYFSISQQKLTDRIPQAALRCSVNGDLLNFPGQGDYADATRVRQKRAETAIYTDRLAAEYKRGREYMDEVSFSMYQVKLPLLLKGNPQNHRLGMSDHQGKWECSIRINGETVRTFRWTVGNDGRPVPHPEQASGNVNLAHNGFLIEAEVPAGGSSFDHRLLPLPNDGIFYGVPWSSTEGKSAAAKVPTKGRPYHVPSTTR